jgi:hypothetical protein
VENVKAHQQSGELPLLSPEGWFAAFDDAPGQAAVRVGYEIWINKGLAVQMSDIVSALKGNLGILQYPVPPSP